MSSPRDAWYVRALDGAVSWFVGAIAWWTVVFHVATPLDIDRDIAGAIWVVGLVAAAVALGLHARERDPLANEDVRIDRRWAVGLAIAAVAAAGLSATRWPDERPAWWLFWIVVVATCGLAVRAIVQARPAPAAPPREDGRAASEVSPLAAGLVLALAVLAAIGSLVTMRPDFDDVFLVNRSTYVEEHDGPIPERDTIFSDEVFAATREDAVPTSVETLVGVIAAWTPPSATSWTYFGLGPFAAGLGILALWRMLRTLGARAPALATSAAAVFLLLDGGSHYSHGNFNFARSWQGKVVFLIVVVPALWHHGLRWARDGSARDLVLLAAAAVAGIGLTTTGVLVGPMVVLVVVGAGAWAAGSLRRFGLGLLAIVPALLAFAVFAVLPKQDPTPVLAWIPPWFTLSGGIEPGRQWHWILDRGVALFIPAASAFLAWLFVRDRAARLALAGAPLLLFAVFYGPGTFDAIADLTGVRVILWRTGWVLPVPAAVGLAVTAPLLLPRSTLRSILAVAAPVAMVAAMTLSTISVLDRANADIRIGRPAWDVNPRDLAAARRLIQLSKPGDLVAAPENVGAVLVTLTTEVRATNPRSVYMNGPHAVTEFRPGDRRIVTQAAGYGVGPEELDRLQQGLERLGVDTACIVAGLDNPTVTTALEQAGLQRLGVEGTCELWRRPDG